MKRGLILILSGLVAIGILTSCSSSTNKNETSKYGVIYSSVSEPKSTIQFYSDKWEKGDNIQLDVGGVQESIEYEGKLYAPVVGTPSSPNDKILQYDIENRKVNYIKTEPFPVKLKAKKNFLYVLHNTNLKNGTLAKINLKDNEIIKKKTIKGTIKDLNITDNKIYVTADNVRKENQTVFVMNLDLDIQNEIINNETAFTTDTAIINQTLYLMNVAKNDFSNPTNQLTEVDIENEKLKTSTLKNPAPYQVITSKDKLFITHYNPPSDSGNHISVIDIATNEVREFTLENKPYKSIISNNSFISMDSNGTIYEYDLKKFKLKKTQKLKMEKGMIITDFFKK